MNLSKKQKQTHRHREQTCSCQRGGGCGGGGEGRMKWEFGCKLICIEWMNHKVLLYNTGNYTQYPGVNYNGKEYKKE